MSTPIPFTPDRRVSQKFPRSWRPLVAVGLAFSSVILGAAVLKAALNHRPFVSAIADQRIPNGGAFATQYFRIFNFDGGTLTFQKMSTSSGWYPALVDGSFRTPLRQHFPSQTRENMLDAFRAPPSNRADPN